MSPLLTIGMPVYNGEKFIRRGIDSLLSQTFSDFEIIISDNASTDSTPIICAEYEKRDKRIHYVRQKANLGVAPNFLFLMQKATSKYCLIAAHDDIWDPSYIEKNIKILESNDSIVGSISQMRYFGELDDLKSDKIQLGFPDFFEYFHAHPKPDSYEKRVRLWFNAAGPNSIYSMFRTDILKKCITTKPFFPYWDFTILVRIMKYGDLNIINEILMYKYTGGMGHAEPNYARHILKHFPGKLNVLFPLFYFTCYAARDLGFKIFIKNLRFFFRVNYKNEKSIAVALLQILKSKIIKK